MNAYEELLVPGSYPFYMLFISIDPAHIDINVHPTKTEIKFEDEKTIYAIIRSAVKRSLGRYNIAPTLDFEADQNLVEFQQNPTDIKLPVIRVNPDFNPFDPPSSDTSPGTTSGPGTTSTRGSGNQPPGYNTPRLNPGNWEQLYSISRAEEPARPATLLPEGEIREEALPELQTFQLHQRYILSHIKSGCIIIDQQAAHERILYERYLDQLENKKGATQQNLFPQTVELSPADFVLVMELRDDIRALGFDFREFGKTTIIVDDTPADLPEGNANHEFEKIIETYKKQIALLNINKRR